MVALNLFHPGLVFGKRGKATESLDEEDTWSVIELIGESLSPAFKVEKV
jgi:hypothetical protein